MKNMGAKGIQLKISLDDDKVVDDLGENSLYFWCVKNNKEYLLEEWDYERNKYFTPKEITCGYGEKVWWIIPLS